MSKAWIVVLALGGLVACADQDFADDEVDTLEQVGVDGGVVRPGNTSGLDGSVTVTPAADGGADAGADAGGDASTRR